MKTESQWAKQFCGIQPARTVAKITIGSYTHVDEVIYYRANMSIDMLMKWKWYFEYLAAKVKVCNPRKKVEFYCGPMTDDVRVGQDWIDYHTKNLLVAKKRKVKQLQKTMPADDLFDFNRQEHQAKVDKLLDDIKRLNEGTCDFYVFPEYKNKIKQYLKCQDDRK